MAWLAALLLLLSPEAERMLLGPSLFFRHEGMRRAVREGDTVLLERAAASDLWDVRRLAAQGLGARTPLALLDDRVAVVREAALRGLDVAVPPETARALLADPDDAVRDAAAWALRGAKNRSAVRALFDDPAPSVRWTALASADEFGRLQKLAERGDFAERIGALQMLGRAGGASEAAFLLSRFSRALHDAGDESQPLYLRNEPVPDVALARAVGDLARRDVRAGGKTVAEHLARLLEREELAGNAPLLLAEAVAPTHDARAVQHLLDVHLRQRRESTLPDPWLTPALSGILHALAREDWPGLAPLLLPLLEHPDSRVRLAAAAALTGDAAQAALDDADHEVRMQATARLETAAPLRRALADRDPAVQAVAVRAIGLRGVVGLLDEVTARLDAADPAVRRAALGALMRIDAPGRGALLLRVALEDPSDEVRATAAAVLEFLAQPGVLEAAVEALGSPAVRVRRNAIALIHGLVEARLGYDPEQPEEGRRRWAEWLARRQAKPSPPDAFVYHVEDLRRRGLDVVLVMDATGSMAPVVQATKRRIVEVMDRLRTIVPDLRARVVAYRDSGDAFLTLSTPLTHDARLLEDFLACVPACGGGDGPEAVLAGLRSAMEETRWRDGAARVVLLFGDAPPHDRDQELLGTLVGEFDGVVHAVDVSGFAFVGGVPGTEPAFRAIAERGRGAFVRLGEGDGDDLLRQVLVLVLGPRHRAAIETLFGL